MRVGSGVILFQLAGFLTSALADFYFAKHTLTRTDIPERQQIVPIQLASDTAAATSAVNGQSDICIRIGEISIEIREGVSSGTIRDVVSAVRQSC